MKEWRRKFAGWLRRDAIGAELQEEMRAHLEMKAAAGGDPRQFGNRTLLLEDARAAWGWPRLETWVRDLRYGLRMMARRPGFAATVVLTLALGIGASSTIFSLIDAVLIRPLPYPDAGRLVSIWEQNLSTDRLPKPVAPGRLADWQRLARSFDAIGGSSGDTFTEAAGAVPERISGAFVSPQFFGTLGVAPALGRTFTAEEERSGGASAIIISDGLWRRAFAGDPHIIGRTMLLGGRNQPIVGVMPPGFQYPLPTIDIWAPGQIPPSLMQIREARFLLVIARLKPGVTLEQATEDLNAVQKTLGEQYPKTDVGWGVTIEPLKDRVLGKVHGPLWLLFGSAAVLLLITCANVACLLLGQLNSRRAEIATRLAIGAGRMAIARQLFAEGAVYALAGGALGVCVVLAGVGGLRGLTQVPRITELAVDGRVLGLVIAVSAFAAILFSFSPILQTFRSSVAGSLILGSKGIVRGGQRLTRLLVSAQLAMATVLLIGAGLFQRSLLHLQETPLQFMPDRILALRISASFQESPPTTIQRHQRALDTLASLPGVKSGAMSAGLPGASPTWPTEFHVQGERDPEGVKRYVRTRVVTSDYFQTLGIPILAGETCRMTSDMQRPFEALINRKLADRYFAGRNPIGHILTESQFAEPLTIRGVVADVRERGYAMEPELLIYTCGYLRYWPDSDFLIRTEGSPAQMANAVRDAIRRIEPGRAVYAVRPMADVLDGTLSQNRFRALLIGLFSAMALALAAIGLYGVMAYMVTQRTREFGIRMAMGARPVQIMSGILGSAGRLTVAGAVVGVALAAIASRLVETLLYGVRPFDAISYVSAAGVLFAVALLACLIPGRRATSIDPAKALREQ